MKKCIECGRSRPLKSFYVHSRMKDGHLNKCKKCVTARVKRHRQVNLEAVRAYDRSRGDKPHRVKARLEYYEKTKDDPEVKARRAAGNKAWQERNTVKRAAHILVGNALRGGRIKRPDNCSACGVGTPEAHHDDYEHPLDVTWLCRKCHMRHHKDEREEERA